MLNWPFRLLLGKATTMDMLKRACNESNQVKLRGLDCAIGSIAYDAQKSVYMHYCTHSEKEKENILHYFSPSGL